MVGSRFTCAIAAALLLAAGPCPAQDASPTGLRPILLLVTGADGSGLDADGLALVSRSALQGLQADPRLRGGGASFVEPAPGTTPVSDDARSVAAGTAGAGTWVWVEVLSAENGARVHVRSYDIERGAALTDEIVTLGGALLPLDLPGADWSPVAAALRDKRPDSGPASAVYAPSTALIEVSARPGSTVQVSGGPRITLDAQGNGSISLPAPAEYSLRVTSPGYAPVTRSVYLTSDRELSVPQVTAPRWALEVSLADMSFPSVGASWFPLPDSLSVGLGFTTYALGFALNDTDVVLSLPLTNVWVRLGLYVAPPDSLLRPYLALIPFVRLIHAPVYFGLDPLAPVGLQLAFGAEIGRTLHGGVFLEYIASLYPTSLTDLFRASLGSGDTPEGWIFAPGFVLNVLAFRVGYRWTL